MTTPRTRVLIVDDEPLARERLRTLLEDEPAFEVVGEAADGTTGAESILALQPDLVFLDVQMPGADGFGAGGAVGGLADQLERRLFFQQGPDPLARERLVVHDQNAGVGCRHDGPMPRGTRRAGPRR